MVDVALALGEQERRGRSSPSRATGCCPEAPARPGSSEPLVRAPPTELRLAELVTRIESEIASAEQNGADWREVVDALRPYTNRIGAGLSEEDREEFRSATWPGAGTWPPWMAPEIARTLEVMRAEGRLRLARGQPRVDAPAGSGCRGQHRRSARGVDKSGRSGVNTHLGPTLDWLERGALAGRTIGRRCAPGTSWAGMDHDSRGCWSTRAGRRRRSSPHRPDCARDASGRRRRCPRSAVSAGAGGPDTATLDSRLRHQSGHDDR